MVSTDDGVLVIGGSMEGPWTGGPYATATVAEYKDGNWSNIGNLSRSRHNHRAFKSGSEIMIISGNDESLAYFQNVNLPIEIWNLDSNTSRFIDSTPYTPNPFTGAAAFSVDPGFCSRNSN